jgi:hypothetical protein
MNAILENQYLIEHLVCFLDIKALYHLTITAKLFANIKTTNHYKISLRQVIKCGINKLCNVGDADLLHIFLVNGYNRGIKHEMNNALSKFYDKINIIKCLIHHGADEHLNNTAILTESISMGLYDNIRFLHSKGADIHASNEFVLRTSARFGEFEMVRYLVDQGADIHARNDEALKLASTNGHYDVVQYLIQQGCNYCVD